MRGPVLCQEHRAPAAVRRAGVLPRWLPGRRESVWYLEHDADIEDTLAKVGWPIVVTAVTTMAGFASFALMDIAPMREFGWQMVLGTAMCALVALVVIPMTLAFWPLRPAKIGKVGRAVDGALMGLTSFCRRRRWWVIGTSAAIATFFALQVPNIKTSMDPQSFFPEGSAPAHPDPTKF